MTLSSAQMVMIPLLSAFISLAFGIHGGAGLWAVVFGFGGLGLGLGLGSIPIAYVNMAMLNKQWRPAPVLVLAWEVLKLISMFAIPLLAAWLSDATVRHFFAPGQ